MAIGNMESEEYLGVVVGIEYITYRFFSQYTCLRIAGKTRMEKR